MIAHHQCLIFVRSVKRRDDPRNLVLFEVLSLVQLVRPDHLLVECVPGILSHDQAQESENGLVVRLALRILTELK